MKHIKFEAGADGVALVTLDNATEPMNVVSPEWIEEMLEVIERIKGDAAILGAVITSAKPAFMAGADLKYILSTFGKLTPKDAYAFSQRATAMHRKLETSGKPFVAALNGLALGGGFELALACHASVLVDDPKAVVGMPEVTVGLLPGSGGTQRLARMIGVAKALPLLLDGANLGPADALKAGLVDAVTPAPKLIEAARELALRTDPVRAWDKKGYANPEAAGLLNLALAGASTAHVAQLAAKTQRNYPAPIAILAAVVEGVQLSFDKALSVESKYFARLMTSVEARNIIRTMFVNKGAAEKLARRPKEVGKRKVTKLGVLGAGMMGAGIAHVSATAGVEVVLIDQDLAVAEKGKAYSAKVLAKEVERGRRAQADADAILARIKPSLSYGDLKGAELVIEAVFEDTAIKADVTSKAEAVLSPDAVFASNTSTLPISALAEASARPANFIGLHFFSPVERMGLVEVIVGRETSQETLAHALDFVAQLRKTPIVVNDSRGFYTSRVFQTFIHEGMALLQEGVAPALIENAAKMAGMPVGPLALLDEVTIELPMKIVMQAEADPNYRRPVSYDVMRRMLEELKRPSRKAGGGFYDYPEGAPKRLWRGLAEAFPVSPEQPSVEAIKQRLMYIQALETARCLEQQVLTHPADGDLGAVLGWAFPTYTGGTLSFIDTIGIQKFVADCDRLAQSCGPRFQPSTWLRQRAEKGQGFYE